MFCIRVLTLPYLLVVPPFSNFNVSFLFLFEVFEAALQTTGTNNHFVDVKQLTDFHFDINGNHY